MAFTGSIDELRDATVVSSDDQKIGSVGQVYVLDGTDAPSWVTVNTGFFGMNESLIPLADATYSDGELRVPYDKELVKNAPNVDEDADLTIEQEDQLYSYYGIASPHGADSATTGDTGGTIPAASAGATTGGAARGVDEGRIDDRRADDLRSGDLMDAAAYEGAGTGDAAIVPNDEQGFATEAADAAQQTGQPTQPTRARLRRRLRDDDGLGELR